MTLNVNFQGPQNLINILRNYRVDQEHAKVRGHGMFFVPAVFYVHTLVSA